MFIRFLVLPRANRTEVKIRSILRKSEEEGMYSSLDSLWIPIQKLTRSSPAERPLYAPTHPYSGAEAYRCDLRFCRGFHPYYTLDRTETGTEIRYPINLTA